MLIQSIVRITQPGACCSYPVGRFEVYHTDDSAAALEICDTFNRCRYSPDLGFYYEVETVDELSPHRAPESARRVDAVCVPNCVFS